MTRLSREVRRRQHLSAHPTIRRISSIAVLQSWRHPASSLSIAPAHQALSQSLSSLTTSICSPHSDLNHNVHRVADHQPKPRPHDACHHPRPHYASRAAMVGSLQVNGPARPLSPLSNSLTSLSPSQKLLSPRNSTRCSWVSSNLPKRTT